MSGLILGDLCNREQRNVTGFPVSNLVSKDCQQQQDREYQRVVDHQVPEKCALNSGMSSSETIGPASRALAWQIGWARFLRSILSVCAGSSVGRYVLPS